VLSAAVLEALIDRRPIPVVAGESYALRQQFAIAWGLPLEPMVSDFYPPEPIAVPEPEPEAAGPAAEEPVEPPVPEPPPAEPAPAEPTAPVGPERQMEQTEPPPVAEASPHPPRLPLRRKVAREAARLVAQAKRLLGHADRPAPEAPPAEPPPPP
jgi:hypothetical protein